MVTNEALKDYRMYTGARDYGNNLDVSWYLTCEPGFLKKTFSSILTQGATDKAFSFNLDIFQQQDLNALELSLPDELVPALRYVV